MDSSKTSRALRPILNNLLRNTRLTAAYPFPRHPSIRSLHSITPFYHVASHTQPSRENRLPHYPRYVSTSTNATPVKERAVGQSNAQTQPEHPSTEDESHRHPLTDRAAAEKDDSSAADEIALRKALSPAYQLWFTCKKCLDRSGHTVSKQSYHFGTTVIRCPKCKSQHLISDHLKIFSDTGVTMEDIVRQHGQLMKKGRLGADGDVEFYDDAATEKMEEAQRIQIAQLGKGQS